MDSTQLNGVKGENVQQEVDGFCMEEHLPKTMEFQALQPYYSRNNFFEFEPSQPYSFDHQQDYHYNYINYDNFFPSFYEFDDNFQDFINNNNDNNHNYNVLLEDKLKTIYELFEKETKPQNLASHDGGSQLLQHQNCDNIAPSHMKHEGEEEEEEEGTMVNNNGKRENGRFSKSAMLEFDEIQKYFDVPISKAAKELKVGLTVLKKRCRELNIMRWPHRKIKSLKSLINNVKEMGLTKEIEMLEEHKRMLETIPQMELTEKTKKLRQACFKANYKKRRSSLLAN